MANIFMNTHNCGNLCIFHIPVVIQIFTMKQTKTTENMTHYGVTK